MDIKNRVGIRIKTIRKQRKLTQQQLGDKIGRSIDALSNIERGKSLPGFETLEQLSVVLAVPIKDFFDFEGEIDDPVRGGQLRKLMDLARMLSEKELGLAVMHIEAIIKFR